MHIQRHTHTGTHVQSAHKRNGDNRAQEPGWEGRKKGFVRNLAHTKQKTEKHVRKKPIFTNLKKIFEHIELPAKLLEYFLRSNKSNLNQMYIYIYTYTYIYVYSIYIHIYVYTYICIYIYMHIHISYIYTHVFMYLETYAQSRTSLFLSVLNGAGVCAWGWRGGSDNSLLSQASA